MPYLHWETDRGRVQSADAIKEAGKQRLLSISEVVSQAKHRAHNDHSVSHAHGFFSSNTGHLADQLERRTALGRMLKAAASLLEAMEFHAEERLIYKYLHARPPLHPRRTLDQSYYGALKNTGTRDRDQVVYRGTAPGEHDCAGQAYCEECKNESHKVSRIIMVDQLWLWILDESKLSHRR